MAADTPGLPGNRWPKSGDTYLGLGLGISTGKAEKNLYSVFFGSDGVEVARDEDFS